MYESLVEAVARAESDNISLGELALRLEAEEGVKTRPQIEAALGRALSVMREAVARGSVGDLKSVSGLVGGDAAKLKHPKGPLAGSVFTEVLAAALAVQEVNAAMGVIVAAPTAGGAGVLPAVLLGIGEAKKLGDDVLIRGLAAAGLVGAVVAVRASLSGAEGGCQAETGAAAAMAAAAGIEILDGTPRQSAFAVSLTMQGTLGLICDPLGGLVEVPCVYRNATGAAMALAGIEMALAGIEFPIPSDEVIDTMGEIGRGMDIRYRETAGGGLAATPTGRKLAKDRLVQLKGKKA
ncbi:MAG: L-serine ammonia-lyase, iron-sulfur-dependent, subunit alpha [Gemmatimonadetes bacterium]|nr:L-serine ammonia-lyase, iron-sulfur-dependent, subunit alpha [Gemmatimonadota bacterium]